MKANTFRLLLVLLALLAVSSLSSCLTAESQRAVQEKTQVPGLEQSLIAKDRAIAAAVEISLSSDVELVQNKLTVECRNARVVLSGKVPTEELKKRAGSIAENQEGVKEVLNEIEVDPSLKDQRFSLDDM
jgi:osmotically-inducible protein OsmY